MEEYKEADMKKMKVGLVSSQKRTNGSSTGTAVEKKRTKINQNREKQRIK